MFRGLVTALRTLTSLPVPGREADCFVDSLPWFPVVGLFLGAIIATMSCFAMASATLWTFGLSVLLILAGICLTRGLHLDGLADWADGFWGGHDREKVLRIMKDPCIGSFGAMALVFIMMAKWVGYVGLILDPDGWRWITAAYVISRTMQVDLACTFDYARTEGGTAAKFVEGAGWRQLAPALVVCLATLILLARPQWLFLLILPACWLATRLFGMWCRRRIGGITGDLLGACSELVETGVVFAGSFMGVTWTT